MRILRHLPNFLTCCNLLCGCLGILQTIRCGFVENGHYVHLVDSSIFIILGVIFDFLDGLTARLLKAYSPIGKQLDSLADMVTFGVLPSFILYHLIELSVRPEGDVHYVFLIGGLRGFLQKIYTLRTSFLPLTSFSIAIFSALRLAKFNIDERQTDQFIGLPTPANALLVASLPFILQSHPEWNKYILNPITLSVYIVVMCGLMVAELPLFALKFKHFRWAGNKLRYGFLLASLLLLILLQVAAVPLIIGLYVLLSIILKKQLAQPTIHHS